MVTVIITTYKRQMDILKRAVNSVVAQTYKDIQLIIVNDYPAYKNIIESALKDYDVEIVHNENNRGACYSRNVGIQLARGEYIAYLDDDDEWMPTKIENQLSAIKDEYDMVYCQGKGIYPSGDEINLDFIMDCGDNPLKKILSGNCFGGCSYPLIKTSVLKILGGFDEDFKSSQDHELWIRIAEQYKIRYLDEQLVKYYISDCSITGNYKNRVQGYNHILSKHKKLIKKYPCASVHLFYQYMEVFLKLHKFKYVVHYFLKSFIIFPVNLWVIFLGLKRFVYCCKKIFKSSFPPTT